MYAVKTYVVLGCWVFLFGLILTLIFAATGCVVEPAYS